jgi:hypothetical protein
VIVDSPFGGENSLTGRGGSMFNEVHVTSVANSPAFRRIVSSAASEAI